MGYIGAGKTLCGAAEAFTRAVAVPGRRPGKTLICRENMADLRDSTYATFSGMVKETCPDIIHKLRESQHELRLTLKTDWEFIFTHLHRWEAFGSTEYDAVWIDECNDPGIDRKVYEMLTGRIGRGRYDNALWTTGNPAGKNWNYDLFFRHLFENTPPKRSHEGFQPGAHENDHNLGAEYWDELRELWSEEMVQKFINGSFDIYEGAILGELNPALHLVDPFRIPTELPRYRGLDHGIDHPTAAVWVAVDYQGNHIVYREHVKSDAVPASNVEAILAASAGEEEQIRWTAIDPSTQQRQTAGGVMQSLVEQYRDAGLYCRLANNDMMASIALLKNLLKPDPTRLFPKWHPRAGQFGAPALYISRDCRVTWSQLQGWRWRAVKPGQMARVHAFDDDTVAALRYLLMEKPPVPTVSTASHGDWLDRAISEIRGRSHLENPSARIGA